jgi:hypothetical protein
MATTTESLALLTAADRKWTLASADSCRRLFVEGRLKSMALAMSATETMIMALPFRDEWDKDYLAMALRHELARAGATIVMTVFEAWYKPFATHAEAREHFGKPVEKMPGRVEVLHFTVESTEAAYHGTARIERGSGGVTVGAVEWQHAPDAQGRWANLLPRTRGTREGVN